ncbi:hypothetical protein RFI_01378 [Reticulomyxa filosa]|uniref:Uncharacterized protein n=1 Tax=Reticulomyxa filosa TaxID=46433 RepID=X6PC91_RETFI|nr:hypothetical protein RFI_01378 [Reticulomyxa filosa]|eukprot:ETO35684.1 hypothetical protein RFI_01378 [Reticulomyxa filosa]
MTKQFFEKYKTNKINKFTNIYTLQIKNYANNNCSNYHFHKLKKTHKTLVSRFKVSPLIDQRFKEKMNIPKAHDIHKTTEILNVYNCFINYLQNVAEATTIVSARTTTISLVKTPQKKNEKEKAQPKRDLSISDLTYVNRPIEIESKNKSFIPRSGYNVNEMDESSKTLYMWGRTKMKEFAKKRQPKQNPRY